MKRKNFDHGFPQESWEAARNEAREAMIGVAARRGVIAYSDLVVEIQTLDLPGPVSRCWWGRRIAPSVGGDVRVGP